MQTKPRITAKPVMTKVETIPIEVAIRLEQTRLQDLEFDTDKKQSDWLLQYMHNERRRGVREWVTNF